jgi:ATP-dependent DNA ligase
MTTASSQLWQVTPTLSSLCCEGIVSKRLGSLYRSGRANDWRKIKNPAAPAVKREAEEDWNGRRWTHGRRS